MRSPIEEPAARAGDDGEPELIVGGLWGVVQRPPREQPWIEWTADREDQLPTVVLGRE